MSVRTARTLDELSAGLSEGFKEFSSKIRGKRVLIKASLGYPKPPPFTVDIRLVKVVASILQKFEAEKINLIEGSTAINGSRPIARMLGFDRIEGVEFVDADDAPISRVRVLNGTLWDHLYLPKILLEADFKISIAVLKVEDGAKFYSGVVKNLLGMPPRRIYRGKRPWARGKLHRSLSSSIIDLFHTANFDYGVLDAKIMLRGMANTGKPHEFGTYYFGRDLLEIDKRALTDSGFQQAFAPLAKHL
ncbi:MAG: DUF362 domain-containing protein [Thaumarchaeota archaeon]|nr:DUF362 domain-containing protein [Nitrososphaerota archaeon]